MDKPISDITMLGSLERLRWSQTADALLIEKPQNQLSDIAVVLKFTPRR
ncbi:MAG: hypothetical protein V4671_22990 [Armatimonadota bacterium]